MRLELHVDALKNFDAKAENLVLELATHPSPQGRHFSRPLDPDLHIAANISDNDIIGELELGLADGFGNETGKFFRQGDTHIGLFNESYKNLVRLAEGMQKTKSLRSIISVKTLIGLIFTWIKARHLHSSAASMSAFVLSEAGKLVQEIEIWIPVAYLCIQSNIQLGNVAFKTVTREMLDSLFSEAPPIKTQEEELAIKQFMARTRRDLQGFAAAVVQLTAEPDRAAEIAFEEAENSVSLLRFFSPANFSPRLVSYCTLRGKEHRETSRHLVVQNGKIILDNRRAIDRSETVWALSNAEIAKIKNTGNGLEVLNKWLCKDRRSDFEQALIDSLILYSKSSLAKDATDKLVYILVSLESVLLKDNNEAIQNNLGERLAFSIGVNVQERKDIIANTKKIYELRSSFIHHGH